MKVYFSTMMCSLVFLAGGGASDAASWLGGDGNFQDASKWDTGEVPNYDNSDTVNISGSVTVTDTEKRDWWQQNVTISDGATLNCTQSVAKWQNGVITVKDGGRLIIAKNGDMTINPSGNLTINCLTKDGIRIEEHIKISQAVGNLTSLNFGSEGSMYINEIWNNNWNVSMSFTLDTGISGETALYSIETRTLVDMDHNTGGGITNMFASSSSALNMAGESMVGVSSREELTLDAAGLSKYYLYRDDTAGGDWVVAYVKASAPVPEPSVALMGMLGFAGIFLRRRR